MGFSPGIIFEAAALALALSIDAFVASLAYGCRQIKIPMLSVHIITAVCSCIFGVSLLAGSIIRQYIPPALTSVICFGVLFFLGLVKLLDCVTKSFIRRHNSFNKEVRFSMLNIKFILNLYANPEDADVDASRVISPAEAASLAAALSLDGLAVGFGAAMGNVSLPAALLCSLGVNTLAVLSGSCLGARLAKCSPFDFSWLGGALLMILALLKL